MSEVFHANILNSANCQLPRDNPAGNCCIMLFFHFLEGIVFMLAKNVLCRGGGIKGKEDCQKNVSMEP